jgi:hypothetical protein
VSIVPPGRRPISCTGSIEDVLRLVTDALDLLEQERKPHGADVAAALHRDVHDEFAAQFLFGEVDAG